MKGKKLNLNREQIAFIRQRKTLARKKLAIKFNREFGYSFTREGMTRLCCYMGLSTGRNGRFKKGHLPHNTGTKGVMKVNSGSFQDGHLPKNHRVVGSERINVDGYVEVKTEEPNIWRFKNIEVWEKGHQKKVPKDYIIIFKDCDQLNFNLENLEAIPRKLSLRMNQNSYKKTPQEFRSSVELISKIQVRVFEVKEKF